MYLWTMHGYLHIIDIINGHFYSFKNKRVSFSYLWTAWKLEKFIVNICEDGHGFQTMVIVQVSHRYLLKLQVKEVFIQFITKCIKKKKKEENFYEISVCSFFLTKYSEETPKRTPNRTTFSLGFKLNKIWPSKLNLF